MVRVKTYLKIGDEFIPVDEFDGRIPDSRYIEGAILLEIDGVEVLSLKMWDYVDQLWAYIARGLVELGATTSYSTGLPDQPTEVVFRTDERRQRITVEATPSKGRVVASAPYDEFMTAMCEEGQEFFRRMAELVPENRTLYEKQLARLKAVIPYARHR